MNSQYTSTQESPKQKVITVLPRHRKLLHQLLNADTRHCSTANMEMLRRFGWVYSPDGRYELTQAGRYLAEQSEAVPLGRKLELTCP